MACFLRLAFAVSRLPLEIVESVFVFLMTVFWTSLNLEEAHDPWLGSLWQISLQICRIVIIWTSNKVFTVGQRRLKVALYLEKFICIKLGCELKE